MRILLHVHSIRFVWLCSILTLCLQRVPIIRVLIGLEPGGRIGVGHVLRALIPAAVAGSASVHAQTGATQFTSNPASPVSGTVGEELSVVFAFSGGSVSPESYSIVGTLPPGMTVPNATGAVGNLTLNSFSGSIQGTPTESGEYSVDMQAFDNPNRGAGEHGSSAVFTLTFNIEPATVVAPEIVTQPTSMTSLAGTGAFFSVRANGSDLQYEWQKDGTPLAGENGPTLFLGDVQADTAGTYSCVVSNAGGEVASAGASLSVVTSGSVRLSNMSARARVGTGGDILIPGVSIGGTGEKNLLVRAAGPVLLPEFGVQGALADPRIVVFSGGTPIANNDDWAVGNDLAEMEEATNRVGAFLFGDSTKDSALILGVQSGGYTLQTSGVNGVVGVALVELYDLDPAGSSARLVNLSARAVVGTGADILIPGFVVEGNVAMTLLIRGVGPTLAGPEFNVEGALADPVMTVFRGGVIVAVNDDWQQAPNQTALVAAQTATGAFELLDGGRDAALLVALQPGAYTVQVAGKDQGTGVGLVELYVVAP